LFPKRIRHLTFVASIRGQFNSCGRKNVGIQLGVITTDMKTAGINMADKE
jgi:hypothetical protein